MPQPKIVTLPFEPGWVDFNEPAGALHKRLKRYEDPWYAHFVGSALPKSSCPVLGVRVAPIRQTVKEILAVDGERFLDAVLYPPKTGRGPKRGKRSSLDSCEARIAVAFLIGQAKISFDKRLDAALAFLPFLDSWLLCDTLAGAIKPKASETSDLWEFVGLCRTFESEYARRFALVATLKRFVDKAHIAAVFDRLEEDARRGFKSHTVSMAAAWLLCEAFVKLPDAAIRYFRKNSLDDATFNRAIQKICESRRVDGVVKEEIAAMKRVKRRPKE